MRPIQITRDVQIEFARHNIGIAAAKREYDAHPTAACIYGGCFDVATNDEGRCAEHAARLDAARARMRDARGGDDAA